MLRAFGQLEDDQGWAPLSALGSRLAIMAPDFDPRSFGFRKLSDLVRGTNKFEVEQANGGPLRIRSRSCAPTCILAAPAVPAGGAGA